MKEYVPVAKDCEHCSKKMGSLGCCSTVNNNWVYACAKGHKDWLLNKISTEVKALSPEPTAHDVVDGNPVKDAVWETIADVLQIIDKYREESEGKK